MANLQTEEVYNDVGTAINVRRVFGAKGESQNIRVGISKPLGVQFLTSGSIRIFNSDADFWDDLIKGDRIHDPVNWSTHRATGKFATAIATENDIEWYCILDPTLQTQWDGEVHLVAAGESLTLNGMQGKRIFLATASATINGVEADKHKVCFFQNSNEATITAPTNSELVFAVFYNPEEVTQ